MKIKTIRTIQKGIDQEFNKYNKKKQTLEKSIDSLKIEKSKMLSYIQKLEQTESKTLFEQIHNINFIRELKKTLIVLQSQIEQLESERDQVIQKMKELHAIKKAYEKLEIKLYKSQRMKEEKHEQKLIEENYQFHTRLDE